MSLTRHRRRLIYAMTMKSILFALSSTALCKSDSRSISVDESGALKSWLIVTELTFIELIIFYELFRFAWTRSPSFSCTAFTWFVKS